MPQHRRVAAALDALRSAVQSLPFVSSSRPTVVDRALAQADILAAESRRYFEAQRANATSFAASHNFDVRVPTPIRPHKSDAHDATAETHAATPATDAHTDAHADTPATHADGPAESRTADGEEAPATEDGSSAENEDPKLDLAVSSPGEASRGAGRRRHHRGRHGHHGAHHHGQTNNA